MTHEACSLCRKEESQVGRLARVQAALICDGCIDLCTGIVAEADEGDWRRWRVETIHDECSFCGRRGREVGGLIAGRPPAHSCRDCIELAAQSPGAMRRTWRRRFWLVKMAVKAGARFVAYTPLRGRARATGEGKACSFCGRSEHEAGELTSGNAAFVCDRCLRLFSERTEGLGAGSMIEERELTEDESREVCSFCGKSLDHVRKLIEGRDGRYICDECVRRYTEGLA